MMEYARFFLRLFNDTVSMSNFIASNDFNVLILTAEFAVDLGSCLR